MYLRLFSLFAAVSSLTACHSQKQSEYSDYIEEKYVHKYGVEVEPDFWMDCGASGQKIITLRDGVVVHQTYAHGRLNGESVYFFPQSSQRQKVENYAEDVLVAETSYNTCGIPISSIQHTSPDIRTETIWYESGHPKSIERFERDLLITGEYFDIHNKRDSWICNGIGERIVRDECGYTLWVDSFRGGELVMRTSHYPNGTPREITPYASNQIHGERRTFYPGGEPMAIETWFEGQQTGLTTLFQNGEKYAEIPYLNNHKNGVERRFSDGATISQEITWHANRMHGPTYTYVGDSVQSDWFYNGRLTTRSNYESFGIPKQKR